jgi:hypothetical protein
MKLFKKEETAKVEEKPINSKQYELLMTLRILTRRIYDMELQVKKKQIIENCNECASDIFRGQIAIGKSVGEQFYNKKYSK